MTLFFEKLILWTLIFLIPLQTRKILYSWNPGRFNEYLNAYLYVTDLLIVCLIALWLVRCLRKKTSPMHSDDMYHKTWMRWGIGVAAACVFVASILSLAGALDSGTGLYHVLKLGEFLLLFFYFFANSKILNHRILAALFVGSGIIQSLWAALQFFTQSDIGIKMLQESPIGVDLPYVANFFVGADKFIRAYGGFPHPNVLAAFLLISISALYFLFLEQNQKVAAKRTLVGKTIIHASYSAAFFILLLGLILTFSRVALAMYAGGTIICLGILVRVRVPRGDYRGAIRALAVSVGISTAILFIIFSSYLNARFRVNSQEEAVVNRVRYNEESTQQIKRSPVFGVGIGNFIPVFKKSSLAGQEEFYQPVHNIYLLIASEMGILGFLSFLFFIGFILFRSARILLASYVTPLLVVWGVLFVLFLILGFFDHFFWTLQQGRLMFWIVLGLLAGSTMRSSYRDE